ncbi:MAG: redoxin domain-containing protein [Planctomycetes bacterium]|nr:redoxin domain-containing protein [Planctomycetota bacterium]
MIRRSGIKLFQHGFACFLVVIALVGCNRATPGTASNSGSRSAEESVASSAIPSGNDVTEPGIGSSAVAASSEAHPTTDTEATKTSPQPVDARRAPVTRNEPKVALSVPDPPEYVYEPQVIMTQRDAATCLVKPGEPFPAARLSDVDGQEHSLEELLGEKLTVIVFWDNANRLGREQIRRLESETVVPFRGMGLNVVAINSGDSSEQIIDLLPTDREPDFSVLLDTDSSLFAKVATERRPRTYLLDSEGSILWFDIEYSRGSARDLSNAIHVYLGNRKTGDS